MHFYGQIGYYPLESTGESSRNKNIPPSPCPTEI